MDTRLRYLETIVLRMSVRQKLPVMLYNFVASTCTNYAFVQEQAARDAAKAAESQIPLEDRLSEADKLLKDLGISMIKIIC